MRFGAMLLAVLSSVAARADVLDVGGPAPAYAQIADAVAAAVDGDVIRVWPGTYAHFAVNGKSLTIVRATPTGQVLVAGTIRITGLAADQDAEFTGISAQGTGNSALLVYDCEGSVRIREGVFTGAPSQDVWPNSRWPGVRVENCADVVLTYCTATGGPPSWGEYGSVGAAGLQSIGSHVSLFASSFTGSAGTADDDPGASGLPGGHGVHASGPGALHVSGCTLKGGHGGSADYDPSWWTGEYGYGGDGGWAHSGTAPAWLRDTSLEAGAGGWSPDPLKLGSPGQPTAGGTLLPGGARIVRTSWLLDDLDPLTVRCVGEPGESVWLVESPRPAYMLSDPAFGPLLVWTAPPPLATRWRFLGEVGPDGILLTSFPARKLPPFTHETPHYQAVFLGPGGFVLGSSSWSVRLDAAW